LKQLKTLQFKNWFGYSNDAHSIDFDSGVIQLDGENGAGKTSIILIIQEVLFGKNFRNIKKSNLVNRHNSKEGLYAEITFGDYRVIYERKASLNLTLLENGIDISGHTASTTYKLIEEKLGVDYNIFTALTYQCSDSHLDFLKATDTTRKDFLAKLLNLKQYEELYNLFKAEVTANTKAVTRLNALVEAELTTISKYKSYDRSRKSLIEVPSKYKSDTLLKYKSDLLEISKINSRINNNNEYKKQLSSITIPTRAPVCTCSEEELHELQNKRAVINHKIETNLSSTKSLDRLQGVCSSCKQPIDISHREPMLKEYGIDLANLRVDLSSLDNTIKCCKNELQQLSRYNNILIEVERLSNLIDNNLQDSILNEEELIESIAEESRIISANEKSILISKEQNDRIIAHNAKIDLVEVHLKESNDKLKDLQTELLDASTKLDNLTIIRDSLSKKGIVAYKIESTIKSLESLINYYLEEVSEGRFTLEFKIVKDQLSIAIEDEGDCIDIGALSSGEFARVNISVLLAIKKFLGLSSINLLFLDEIFSTLDEKGTDSLIRVLLEEQDLSVLLVNHGYNHPLVKKLNVTASSGLSW